VRLGNDTIMGLPENDQERTNESGKTSAVHFLHFVFTAEQIARFRAADAELILGIAHPNYRHMAVLSEETRRALASDFA
ncbi:MAG: DUF3501 family protein, partial [Rhodospirillales bacterium]